MYIIPSKLFTLLPIKNKINNNKHVICQFYTMQLCTYQSFAQPIPMLANEGHNEGI